MFVEADVNKERRIETAKTRPVRLSEQNSKKKSAPYEKKNLKEGLGA
jgi:hypothetical protein